MLTTSETLEVLIGFGSLILAIITLVVAILALVIKK
ncbi:putative holin-like toxin [Bacillus spongiae]